MLVFLQSQYPGEEIWRLRVSGGRVISTMTDPVCAIFTGDYNMSKEESAEAYAVMSALFMNKHNKPVMGCSV